MAHLSSAPILLFAPLFSLLSPAVQAAAPHLIFSHKIGLDSAHSPWMNFVAISADGRTIAANGMNPEGKPGQVSLWTFPSGEHLRVIGSQPLAMSADFNLLATETGILDLQLDRWRFRNPDPASPLLRASFSFDGKSVALLGARKLGQGQISIIRTADGSVSASFGHRYGASLAFSPDNEILASGHWSNVTLWNPRTGERLALLMSPRRRADPNGYNRGGAYICGLAFSPDGKLLAAGTDDGELQIWDLPRRTLLHSIKIGTSDVSKPAFSPNGTFVAAGTYNDWTLSLVEAATGKIMSQVQISMFGCGAVAFSPDGKYLAAPSNGGLLANGKFDSSGTIRVFRIGK